MKKLYLILTAVIAVLSFSLADPCMAQCKDFTENEAMPLLGDYIISGKYNSIKLKEGEDILIFKTLTKGIDYRFVVVADNNLPNTLDVRIETWEGETLYSSVNNKNYSPIWNYKNLKTQRIKIFVNVPSHKGTGDPQEGCVVILSGIKPQ